MRTALACVALASAGADGVGEPDYGFADPSVGRMQATRAALADARRRADDAAAVSGLRITGVRTVVLDPGSDTDEFLSQSSPASGGGGDSDSSTQVSGGTQTFRERVRVVYTAAPLA